MDEMTQTLTRPRFASQWDEFVPLKGQVFKEPSRTVPDQSLTIPEIISRFTRSGLVPATVRLADNGGNIAADPESDPLDDYFSAMEARASAKAAARSVDPVPSESDQPGDPAPAPAGA